MMINREDMMELTRRMTLKRNCFSRIAGAYMDVDGFIDGTFNTHFLNLSSKERQEKLSIAKTIPFAKTNSLLKLFEFKPSDEKSGSPWQCLMALKECGLKNDALLEVLYEYIGEHYKTDHDYGIFFFYGSYDVPVKATDHTQLGESEEVYQFLVCAICAVNKDYEPGVVESGFLFPAFVDRSSDIHRIAIYHSEEEKQKQLVRILFENK